MATYQWSNFLLDNTKKARVLAIPDSGFFLIDFYSDIAKEKILRARSESLQNLVGQDLSELPDPIQKCQKKPGFQLVDCYNSANYA